MIELGDGDIAVGTVHGFKAGVLDVPFAPSVRNQGRVMPTRDAEGALRFLDFGNLPLSEAVKERHREKIRQREVREKRKADYNMIIDDIYSVSRGQLVR